MRKVLAFITSGITIFAIRESYFIITSTDKALAGQKPIWIVIAFSITIPLILLTLWLFKPKPHAR